MLLRVAGVQLRPHKRTTKVGLLTATQLVERPWDSFQLEGCTT